MFSQDDGRLFLRLGIMLSTHIPKTVKSRTQWNHHSHQCEIKWQNCLIHQLQFIQFLIQPILRQQLLMGSGFFYFPVMHHNNFICMLDRRKPVCDHDRSSSIHQPCKCLCDQCFGFCIDVGSCFIENKDLRIISKCPCEGQKLALPGR